MAAKILGLGAISAPKILTYLFVFEFKRRQEPVQKFSIELKLPNRRRPSCARRNQQGLSHPQPVDIFYKWSQHFFGVIFEVNCDVAGYRWPQLFTVEINAYPRNFLQKIKSLALVFLSLETCTSTKCIKRSTTCDFVLAFSGLGAAVAFSGRDSETFIGDKCISWIGYGDPYLQMPLNANF
uniref:Uncharacterized protein n=1 Tax=Romanomermis culicivorax TaxID=13658 RepID=A0A915I613_ROMCU